MSKNFPDAKARKGRRDRIGFPVYIAPAEHERIKALAHAQGRTIESLWLEGISHVLVKNGMEGIACRKQWSGFETVLNRRAARESS